VAATRKQAFTKRIEEAEPSKFGTWVWDGRVPGFGARIYPNKREYVFRYRSADGTRRTVRLGQVGALNIEKARERAGDMYEAVRKGRDPVADTEAERAQERAQVDAERNRRTVADVLDQFMSRYVTANQLRSKREYQSAFDRLVKPVIGNVDIHALRRSQIAEMLDTIEDKNGPVMADRTLAYLRKALNWYAARDDDFNSPIAKGMARTKPRERARRRILSDDEIRTVWEASEAEGAFGAFVRVLLLTAQRRSEVAYLRRQEIDAEGVWTIASERYKTKRPNVVPLNAEALALIEAQPVRADGYVFSPNLSNSGKPKAKMDRALDDADGKPLVPPWTLHDLRRTGKTLMARAGVPAHVSERVLGHVIAGVEGVYDQHDYLPEKRDALARLAATIADILDPAPANVVRLPIAPDRVA
jgi:integrase